MSDDQCFVYEHHTIIHALHIEHEYALRGRYNSRVATIEIYNPFIVTALVTAKKLFVHIILIVSALAYNLSGVAADGVNVPDFYDDICRWLANLLVTTDTAPDRRPLGSLPPPWLILCDAFLIQRY